MAEWGFVTIVKSCDCTLSVRIRTLVVQPGADQRNDLVCSPADTTESVIEIAGSTGRAEKFTGASYFVFISAVGWMPLGIPGHGLTASPMKFPARCDPHQPSPDLPDDLSCRLMSAGGERRTGCRQ